MIPTTCLDCGKVISRGPRCDYHRRLHDQQRRPSTSRRGYGSGWQRFSREQIRDEPWCHTQPRCPYPDSNTPANPLTTDHATLGLVICRRCNSAKRHADAVTVRSAGAFTLTHADGTVEAYDDDGRPVRRH